MNRSIGIQGTNRKSTSDGKRALRALAMGAWLALAASCGTQTTLDSSWSVRQPTGRPFDSVVVVAMMKSPAESREFESAAVAEMEKRGARAVPGFAVLGDNTQYSREELEQRIRGSGADGVMFFKLIGVDTTNTYVPPTQYYVTDAPYNAWFDDPFWGYYAPFPYDYYGYWYPAIQVAYTPGYWTTSNNYRVETCLYRTSDSKLIWTGTSSTYDPEGGADLAGSLTRVVVENLERQQFLQSAP